MDNPASPYAEKDSKRQMWRFAMISATSSARLGFLQTYLACRSAVYQSLATLRRALDAWLTVCC